MNIERFHNELAMRLGYERIVKDKRIMISVEDAEEPCVILKVQGHDEIRFKATGNSDDIEFQAQPEMQKELKFIFDASHQAYLKARNCIF